MRVPVFLPRIGVITLTVCHKLRITLQKHIRLKRLLVFNNILVISNLCRPFGFGLRNPYKIPGVYQLPPDIDHVFWSPGYCDFSCDSHLQQFSQVY